MSPTDIRTTAVGFQGGIRVRFEGSLTQETFNAAEAAVLGAERLGRFPHALILDFSDIEFIDSSGLRMTIDAAQRAKGSGRQLAIVAPRPPVDRVFTITRMHERLPLVESLEDAHALVESAS